MAFDQKRLDELTLDEVVYCHVRANPLWCKDVTVVSHLEQINTEMRQARGLQVTKNYASLLAAFAILDQIGSCYEDSSQGAHPAGGNAFKRALFYFGHLPAMGAEINALYALRNGLVHDGSLTSQDQKTGKWYCFRYFSRMSEPVRLPTQNWDGTFQSLSNEKLCLINSRELTEIASRAIHRVDHLLQCERNKLNIIQSKDEIITKYLMWRRRENPA